MLSLQNVFVADAAENIKKKDFFSKIVGFPRTQGTTTAPASNATVYALFPPKSERVVPIRGRHTVKKRTSAAVFFIFFSPYDTRLKRKKKRAHYGLYYIVPVALCYYYISPGELARYLFIFFFFPVNANIAYVGSE